MITRNIFKTLKMVGKRPAMTNIRAFSTLKNKREDDDH